MMKSGETNPYVNQYCCQRYGWNQGAQVKFKKNKTISLKTVQLLNFFLAFFSKKIIVKKQYNKCE